ncbi:MAG TPA: hypothetical protein DCZ75_19780 [Geobacter sp.]|nr:hypothetical protein [Geobacter sp.]
MDPKQQCACPGEHENHICYLHSKGRSKEVEKMTDKPTVTCSICLVNANLPDNVCSPTTLGGGFKYSDMKHNKKILCDTLSEGTEDEEDKK